MTKIPNNPNSDPNTKFFPTFSFKNMPVKIRVKIGREATIIPAFNAVVALSPKKKNPMFKLTPKIALNITFFLSFLAIESFLKTNGKSISDAPPNLKKARVKGGIEAKTNFIIGPFAPQITEAMVKER